MKPRVHRQLLRSRFNCQTPLQTIQSTGYVSQKRALPQPYTPFIFMLAGYPLISLSLNLHTTCRGECRESCLYHTPPVRGELVVIDVKYYCFTNVVAQCHSRYFNIQCTGSSKVVILVTAVGPSAVGW
jgi:hypothetical protein